MLDITVQQEQVDGRVVATITAADGDARDALQVAAAEADLPTPGTDGVELVTSDEMRALADALEREAGQGELTAVHDLRQAAADACNVQPPDDVEEPPA